MAAEHAKDILSPLVNFLLQRLARKLSDEQPGQDDLTEKEQDRYRTDAICNTLQAMRVLAEHPEAKEYLCHLLVPEPDVLKAVFSGTDVLHTYGSAQRDKV